MFGLPDEHDLEELTLVGQLFIMLCYGYILYKAAKLIGDGAEKLLLLYGPGVIGSLVIPILGAVPDGAIVFVSGVGRCAQKKLEIGFGTLAGSTVMLLTVPWAISVLLGYRDYDERKNVAAVYPGTAKPKHENGLSLTKSVVTTFTTTTRTAKIMIMTSVTYLIIFVPSVIYRSSPNAVQYEHWPAFTGMVVCGLSFIIYAIYQIFDASASQGTQMKQKQLEFQKWKTTIARRFAGTDAAIRSVFERIDTDLDGRISIHELHKGLQELGLDTDRQQIQNIFEEMQRTSLHKTDQEGLKLDQFSVAVRAWSRVRSGVSESVGELVFDQRMSMIRSTEPLLESHDLELNSASFSSSTSIFESVVEDEEEELFLELSDTQILMSALLYLLLGASLVCLFSDPMVESIVVTANTLRIDPFFVSFIVTPLTSNAAEVYSSIVFAQKKTSESISLSLSSLYGAACMNNTFVLAVFCALIFYQRLQWTFLVETIVILTVIFIVGVNGSRRTIFVWQALLVGALFPLTIVTLIFTQQFNAVAKPTPGC